MEREELAAWLRLALTPGVGNSGARKLLAAFGLPQSLFSQSAEALKRVASEAALRALATVPDGHEALVEATWAWLCESGPHAPRRILTLADPAYPPTLLQTEDPPLLLYAMGVAVTEWPSSIAIVGSRNPTAQGLTNARQFARTFAQSGWTVVSGMALGIDGAAHEGALEGASQDNLATIAVVGTGLDRVYPKQHLELAHRIVERGVILSEYHVGTPPLAQNFPKRNRIIAGLSQGTVVVEAALQSGSLITARQAAEMGKEVFAIPGSIHSPQARGCHSLIKQGAKLVETAQDVLEELRALPASAPVSAPDEDESDDATGNDGSADDEVLHALGFDPVSLDALVARTGIPPALLQGRLLEHELHGEVARLPGGLYQRVAVG